MIILLIASTYNKENYTLDRILKYEEKFPAANTTGNELFKN